MVSLLAGIAARTSRVRTGVLMWGNQRGFIPGSINKTLLTVAKLLGP